MKTHTMETRNQVAVLAAATLVLGSGLACAQEAAPEKKKNWEGAANAGLAVSSGNSETLLATIGVDAKRKWERDEFLLGASGAYGENDSERSTAFAKAYAQYNHLFTDRFYAGLRVDALNDALAQLSYRINIAPLAGYYFIKNDKTLLSVEVGPSAVIEKYHGSDTDTYLGIRFSQRFEHKLTDTTRFWESVDYTPQVDRWTEKYIINAEVGISTAINKQWDLRVVAQFTHDSEPQPGREYNDFRLIAGTGYKF